MEIQEIQDRRFREIQGDSGQTKLPHIIKSVRSFGGYFVPKLQVDANYSVLIRRSDARIFRGRWAAKRTGTVFYVEPLFALCND
jgi:hypothetical protein